MAARDTRLDPDTRLIDCPDKQAAVAWPLPVDARLDQLLEIARDHGERTSRREIAAALVALTVLDGEGLGVMLRRYRTSRVRDIVEVSGGAEVVSFRRRRPGPRAG